MVKNSHGANLRYQMVTELLCSVKLIKGKKLTVLTHKNITQAVTAEP